MRVPAKQYRLGLLFVHGMGEQERGDTITQMGDALTEWLRRWIRPPGNFTIREATLREGHETSVGTAGPSSHVSVVLTDTDGRSQEWLLAESWWAGAFRPATFKELAVWAIAVGPWLIASQASAILGRIWATPVSGLEWLWKRPLVVLSALAVAIIAALIAAVITPLAIVLLLISRIPLPIVSDVARGLAQNLAGSFGDLLVLVRSPVRFAAMTERVRDDIARLDSQCDRVMVVAHSQGSAVAWQAIRRAAEQLPGNRPDVSLFVSFGQAMRKLKSLYRVHAQAGAVQFQFSVLALLSSVFLVVVLVSAFFAALDVIAEKGHLWEAMRDWDGHWTALLLASVGVLAEQVLLHRMASANDDDAEDQLVGEIRKVRASYPRFGWIDLWGSADPAPNGPLLADPPADVSEYVRSYKLRNMGSTALDHSVYWSNVTEFVSAIAYMASRLVRPNAAQAESLAELRRPIELRDKRVLMLAIGRVIYFVGLAYVMFGVRDSLVAWGSSLRELLGRLPLLPNDWFADWPNFLEGLLAAAVIAGVGLLLWGLLVSWWSSTTRSDESALFDRREGVLWTPSTIAWYLAVRAIPIVAVVAVALSHEDPVLAIVFAVVAAVVARAVVLVLSVGGKRLYEGA